MEKVLMLGMSPGAAQMIKFAKDKGAYVIVTEHKDSGVPGKELADESWYHSTMETELLAAKCKENGVTKVMSGGSDFNITQAIKLCDVLDIPFYVDADAWAYSRDKNAFKKACRKHGVPTARQYFLSEEPTPEEIAQIEFPVIVKPIDATGNAGFGYCYNAEELVENYQYALSKSPSKKVVCEKLLTGPGYTAFYVLAQGEARLFNFWNIFAEPGQPSNCYLVNTSISDKIDYYVKEIDPCVKNMLKDLGYRDGVVWVEFFGDSDGSINALEVASRLSGETYWLPLSDAREFWVTDWLANHALTGFNAIEDLPEDQVAMPDKTVCSYILWTDHEGMVSKISGVDQWYKPGYYVRELVKVGETRGEHRYAIIVAFNADSCEEMVSIMRQINDTVEVLDENGEDMLMRFTDFDSIYALAEKADAQ